MDPTTEITALRQIVAELRAQVDELRTLVTQQRAGGFTAMKASRTCPACGGRHLIHVREAKDSWGGGASPMAIAHTVSSWRGAKGYGPMESITCAKCGLVEFHVTTFEGIPIDGENVVELHGDAPVTDGPLR